MGTTVNKMAGDLEELERSIFSGVIVFSTLFPCSNHNSLPASNLEINSSDHWIWEIITLSPPTPNHILWWTCNTRQNHQSIDLCRFLPGKHLAIPEAAYTFMMQPVINNENNLVGVWMPIQQRIKSSPCLRFQREYFHSDELNQGKNSYKTFKVKMPENRQDWRTDKSRNVQYVKESSQS